MCLYIYELKLYGRSVLIKINFYTIKQKLHLTCYEQYHNIDLIEHTFMTWNLNELFTCNASK